MPGAPDDDQGPEEREQFVVPRPPAEALDAAAAYLEGAGIVATRLIGRVERHDDALMVHHGRVTTRVHADPSDARGGAPRPGHEAAASALITIQRAGQAPLEETRRWLYSLGLLGTLLAWALAVYNRRNPDFLSPLVTIALFFVALLAVVVGLYVVDRSLERRSRSLVASIQDAMAGDPLAVLQREVDALERTSSAVNGLLFYCAAIIVEFLVFATLMSKGIRQAIDEAVTVEVMQWGFGIPIIPALLFAGGFYLAANQLHDKRMDLVRERFHANRSPALGGPTAAA